MAFLTLSEIIGGPCHTTGLGNQIDAGKTHVVTTVVTAWEPLIELSVAAAGR
jgi:hypothetical protein